MKKYLEFIVESSERQSVKVTSYLLDKDIPAEQILGLYTNLDKDLIFFLATESCKYDRLDVIKLLSLEKNWDVHAKYDRIVRTASILGNLDIVKYLVEIGANVKPEGLSRGNDALGYACSAGKLNVVEYLIDTNIFEISVYDIYLTTAINQMQYEVAKYLIENNSAINTNDIKTIIKFWENEKEITEVLYQLMKKGKHVDEECVSWAILKNRLNAVLKAINLILLEDNNKIEYYKFLFEKDLLKTQKWFYNKWVYLVEIEQYSKNNKKFYFKNNRKK